MKTKEEYFEFLGEVRKASGVESLVPDESGLVSVKVDDAFIVNLQFVEATGKILCFIEVAELPPDAGREVYRDLLAGGLFGKETGGGYFALEDTSNVVVYHYLFDADKAAANPEDFVSILEKILSLVDVWASRIRGDATADEAQEEKEASSGSEAESITIPNFETEVFFRP
jgi:hypothetical protein